MENKDSKVWDIMVRSDYLTEILEQTPIWLIRWGNTLFLLFIISLVILSSYIKYPDTISARLELVTKNPPIEVNSLISGKLDSLLIDNQVEITKGDLIARVHSLAHYQDITRLEKIVEASLTSQKVANYEQVQFPESLQLGELGNDYNVFLKEFTNLKYFIKQDYTYKKINSIEKEVQKINELNTSLKKQEQIYVQEIDLAKSHFNRSKKMQEEGLISDEQMENIERALLSTNRAFENARMNQMENDLQIERLEIQKVGLLNDRSLGMNTQLQRIRELLNGLQNRIKEWKQNHLIKANINGILSYDPLLTHESPVTAGESLFYIIPKEENNQIIGICNMPVANSGSVQIGNIAQVRIDAFPYQEYGILEGTVKSISVLSKTNQNGQVYNEVELSFSDTLRTTFGEKIEFIQKMTGSALIVKAKRSLLERIFDRILSIFS